MIKTKKGGLKYMIYKFVAFDITIKKCEFLGESRGNLTLKKQGKIFYKKPSYCFDSEAEAWEFLIVKLKESLNFAEKRLIQIINQKQNERQNQKFYQFS